MDNLHVPMLACHIRPCQASARVRAWWCTVQCVVVIAIILRTPIAETPTQRTVSWNERDISESFHICASLSVSPSLAFMYVSFLAGHFTQILLTGVHGPHPQLSMPCRTMQIRLAPNNDNHLSSSIILAKCFHFLREEEESGPISPALRVNKWQ